MVGFCVASCDVVVHCQITGVVYRPTETCFGQAWLEIDFWACLIAVLGMGSSRYLRGIFDERDSLPSELPAMVRVLPELSFALSLKKDEAIKLQAQSFKITFQKSADFKVLLHE